MLELDLAISPFSHLAARAAYRTTRFKLVNNKLLDKFRSRLIPSVHLELLKLYKIHNPHQVFSYRFESFVKQQFGVPSMFQGREPYHYYVDAVTHPNMSHKYLRKFADTNVMAICNKMWETGELCFPILADALEDQEFPDVEYLIHLRAYPQFSKANFVLQFFLNKRIGWPRGMRTSRRSVGPRVLLDLENRQYQLPAPEWMTTAEREQMFRDRFAGFQRTRMNHPVQSHARDITRQLGPMMVDDEVRGRLLDLPDVTMDRGTLIIGGREYPVSNVQITEVPVERDDELDALRYSLLQQLREQDEDRVPKG